MYSWIALICRSGSGPQVTDFPIILVNFYGADYDAAQALAAAGQVAILMSPLTAVTLCLAFPALVLSPFRRAAWISAGLVIAAAIADLAIWTQILGELAEGVRRELFGEDRIRWTVTLEDPVGYEPIRRTFGLHLLRRFAEG